MILISTTQFYFLLYLKKEINVMKKIFKELNIEKIGTII